MINIYSSYLKGLLSLGHEGNWRPNRKVEVGRFMKM